MQKPFKRAGEMIFAQFATVSSKLRRFVFVRKPQFEPVGT